MKYLWGIALVLASCGSNMRGGGKPDGGGGGGDMGSSFAGCASAEYGAKQEPAAMLVVLDRSSSMATGGKWNFAAQAIVQALDADVFDGMHVGLYAAPSGTMQGPSCIFNFPVACQAPAFPQIDLQLAGAQKSQASSGVRRDIKQWLSQSAPDSGVGDASPLYAAVESALSALQGWSGAGKRILFVVTDGTISCCQFSSRPGFADANGCDHDWEHPDNIGKLLDKANKDAAKPVETFIVGVPGADTYDASGAQYPPYRMRAALSALAFQGAPKHVPATCDGKLFTQSAPDPSKSCHFDMTQGNFSAQSVADAIAKVRGQVLGCVFDLPVPTDGSMIDRGLVNVEYATGGPPRALYKRMDPSNPCTADGCWDWTPDGRIQLVGLACDDITAGGTVSVKIVVGCQTVIK